MVMEVMTEWLDECRLKVDMGQHYPKKMPQKILGKNPERYKMGL